MPSAVTILDYDSLENKVFDLKGINVAAIIGAMFKLSS